MQKEMLSMKGQSSKCKNIWVGCELVKDGLSNNKWAKCGLQAKSYNDIWPKVNQKQSSAMMFVQE